MEILLSCAIVAFLACFCLFRYEEKKQSAFSVDFMNVVFGQVRAEDNPKCASE